MHSNSLTHKIADMLTWLLAIISIGAAWYQTARLFVAFGDPTAPWWPYLAAISIEGGIIVAGLTLMDERTGYTAAIAVLIFAANMALSVAAQVGEAALTGGYELPAWLSLVVRFVAPPAVSVVGAALWGLKIARQWENAAPPVGAGVPPPQAAPALTPPRLDPEPMAEPPDVVAAPGNGARPFARTAPVPKPKR